MRTSEQGIALIKRHEGLRLRAYRCAGGVWTIGWGHTGGVSLGQVISEAEAERLLRADVSVAERCVNADGRSLKQHQFDALVSFVFNVGTANYRKSTLRRLVRANPDDPAIAEEFGRWRYAKGRVLEGLVRRRAEERDLYLGKEPS